MPREKTGVGVAIRDARGSRGQDWLAGLLGVHQTTVSNWEREDPLPPIERLPTIERHLGLKPGTLIAMGYGVSGPPPPPAYEDLAQALEQVAVMRSAIDQIEDRLRRAMR